MVTREAHNMQFIESCMASGKIPKGLLIPIQCHTYMKDTTPVLEEETEVPPQASPKRQRLSDTPPSEDIERPTKIWLQTARKGSTPLCTQLLKRSGAPLEKIQACRSTPAILTVFNTKHKNLHCSCRYLLFYDDDFTMSVARMLCTF